LHKVDLARCGHWADALLILGISVCTTLMVEALTWLLVYRTDQYQKLKLDIEKQTKRLEKKKEAHRDATLGNNGCKPIFLFAGPYYQLLLSIACWLLQIKLRSDAWNVTKRD
jgi:hypothetical protein